jgi:hypothetical protein
MVRMLQNKIVYYKKTIECLHVICWAGSQGRVHCHTAKLELNRKVSFDEVTLLKVWYIL